MKNSIKKIMIVSAFLLATGASATSVFAQWEDWTDNSNGSGWYDVTPPDTSNNGGWSNWGTPCNYCTTDTSNTGWYDVNTTGSYVGNTGWYDVSSPTYTPATYYTTPTYDTTSYTVPTYTVPTYTAPTYYTSPSTYYAPTYTVPTYTLPTYTSTYNTYYPPTNTYYPPTNTYYPPTTQACTQEAYVCPNGTTVGRTGPNCTFAQCPTTTTNPTTPACTTGGILPSPLPPNYNPNAVTNAPCYCPNGTLLSTNGLTCSTPNVPPTTKTCANGTVVNVSDICYKVCPSGSSVPESQTCPTYCADGTQAINGICYRTCTDGSRVAETQSCPTPNRVCPDGSVVPSNQVCPTRTCANGTVIPVNQTCYKTCSNGTTVPEGSVCYRTCPNGTTIPETNLCPTQSQTCWDGSIIPVTSVCPNQYKVCPNGTSVPLYQTCNRVCANGSIVTDGGVCYRTCPNGATVPETQSCPVVVGFPWVDLSIDRSSVPFGGTAVLTWTSQNTSSCVASNGWTGTRPLQGTEPRYNITNGATYTITCYSPSGTAVSDSVSVFTGTQTIKVNNVVTSIPTEITDTSARCNGIGLIANNANSNAWFEYGETQNLGRTTATANIGSAATAPFSNALVGLKPNTKYFCRAVMANANGTVKGDIVGFTTKSKKTVYVKPVIKTTTTVKKTVTKAKAKEIICSDGSVITVKDSSTAQIISNGGKLVEMQLEKREGELTQGGTVTYRLSYKNNSDSTLKDVAFKITLPQEFVVLSASAGAFDKSTRTITVPMLVLPAGAQGEVTWTIMVNDKAEIGKTVVTPAVVSYTIPGTDTVGDVQDEATAYVMGTIMPANTDGAGTSTSDLVPKKDNRSFLPNSLIEWFALFAILLILMILIRSIYISWKGEKTTH